MRTTKKTERTVGAVNEYKAARRAVELARVDADRAYKAPAPLNDRMARNLLVEIAQKALDEAYKKAIKTAMKEYPAWSEEEAARHVESWANAWDKLDEE